MKKKDGIEITELFMAKAGYDFSRCFHGTIKRETDENGNPVVRGKIKVHEGHIISIAEDQWILGDKLDEMVLMVIDYGLHSETGITSDIAGKPYFLN